MKSKFITAQKAGTYDPNAANKSASVTIDSNKLELLKKNSKILQEIRKAIKQYREAPGEYPEDDHEHAVKCIYEIEDLIKK